MKQFTSQELRDKWIQFYTERGHVDVGAVSLVSDGSTGVMFNVAGMQPLMPYLLGEKHPKGTRLCNVQGCVRTNDIDSVGDMSHVTFFEMMGSWSLGDYFKEDRCKWSFELLTQVFGFDADHLAATVFEGDENAPRDEEGAQYRIASGFKPENIYYLPAEDNWWGLEYGPCGPDSEMFYIADVPDCGPNCGPGCHCGKYTELGNDVFMQYEKHKDGTLTPLEHKNVDTGWGLERNLAFLNGTKDVYLTDVFSPIISYIESASGVKYGSDEKLTKSMRILADHLRTSVMLIGDEAKLLPSNAGAGYVLRRLIRRAVRHSRVLNLKTEDMVKIAKMYINDIYAKSYPLLKQNSDFVIDELKKEIGRFESTLENGMKEFVKILDANKASNNKELDGKSAFYLYDTFGFPLELTVELAEEAGLSVDEAGFTKAMEEQKQKARSSQNFSADLSGKDSGVFDELDASLKTEFVGYDSLCADSEVAAMVAGEKLSDKLETGDKGVIIVSKTPFYATMGGQKGDIGVIKTASGEFSVEDTVKVPGGRVGHIGTVTSGSINKNDKVTLCVDKNNRASVCANHSATHLLQAALERKLGDHCHQAGSLVEPDRLRFDFTHFSAITPEEMSRINDAVVSMVLDGMEINTMVLPIEEAKALGATALFGEKYGDTVRVVKMGDKSMEFCGGTHLDNTAKVGAFRVISEGSVASGVRRIEAITGKAVLEQMNDFELTLKKAADTLKAPNVGELLHKAEATVVEVKDLRQQLDAMKDRVLAGDVIQLLAGGSEIAGLKVATAVRDDLSVPDLRKFGDLIRDREPKAVAVLAGIQGEKISILAVCGKQAVASGIKAGLLVKQVCAICGGSGGGKPDSAMGGAKDASKLSEAFAAVNEFVSANVK